MFPPTAATHSFHDALTDGCLGDGVVEASYEETSENDELGK